MGKICLGIDIGGTTIKIGLVTKDGDLQGKWEIHTDKSENGKNILSDIANKVTLILQEKNLSKDDVIGIGLGVPGPVDDAGNVLGCVNLGWGEFNVADELSKITGLKVKAGNDANVAALGEMWQGGATGRQDVVMLTLGTGVGGGVIVGGKVLGGINGAAGELGHFTMKIGPDAEKCGCGKKGCLETLASATGIVRETNKYLSRVDTPSSLRKIDNISAKNIFDEAKEGDKIAIDMVEQLGEYLGLACSYIAATTNPETFVIGGGVSKAGNILLDVIRKHFRENAFHALKNTGFSLATLGNDAGMIGAAKLIIE
ncbi:MAG: glcK2 [Clostridiales bacterium]|jgi:glucokinase|nr:glcK2 [Clostridiales bacterium]